MTFAPMVARQAAVEVTALLFTVIHQPLEAFLFLSKPVFGIRCDCGSGGGGGCCSASVGLSAHSCSAAGTAACGEEGGSGSQGEVQLSTFPLANTSSFEKPPDRSQLLFSPAGEDGRRGRSPGGSGPGGWPQQDSISSGRDSEAEERRRWRWRAGGRPARKDGRALRLGVGTARGGTATATWRQ